MNRTNANKLMADLGKEMNHASFTDNIYLSIRNVGTRVFKNCKFESLEGWMFIWTRDDSFCVKEKDLGDFLVIDTDSPVLVGLKKV